MRPTFPEQLHGVRHVLTEVIAPLVDDAYAAHVLAGVLDTLGLLADAWPAIPAFLAWDSRATGEILGLVGIPVPPEPDDPYDLTALHAHHRTVRGMLEAAMPAVLGDDRAREAAVRLFRDRAARYPLANRPGGADPAHAAR